MGLQSLLNQIPEVILVDKVFNGKECIDKINEIVNNAIVDKYYDIIFMDICMPVTDGFEAS